MKKLLAVILLIMICCVGVFAGCTPAVLDETQAESQIANAIAESLKRSDHYFAKEKIRESKTRSKEFTFNIKKDDATTELDEFQAQLTIHRTNVSDLKSDYYVFSYSLPSTVKAKKATLADYKYYLFKTMAGAEKVSKEEFTPRNVFDYGDIAYNVYTASGFSTDSPAKISTSHFEIENLLQNLSLITQADMDFTATQTVNLKKVNGGAKQQGKVISYQFAVKNENHPYSKLGLLDVRILNGKILRVASLNEDYILDFSYDGPVLTAPNYDTIN